MMKNKKLLIGFLVVGVILIIGWWVLNIYQVNTCANLEKNVNNCDDDSDCICTNKGCFLGNIEYYELCIDKSLQCEDFCGWAGAPAACINQNCTIDYPKNGWGYKDCDKLTSNETQNFCKEVIIGWIIEDMHRQDDITICNQIEDEAMKVECKDEYYSRYAEKNKDPELCQKIISKDKQKWCYIQVAEVMGSLQVCENIKERELCYEMVAVATGNISICEMLAAKASEELDITPDMCYDMAARERKDPTICEKITDPITKRYCNEVTK